MDIDHLMQHRVAKNNSKDESVAFSQSIGARMSAMEHLVPEQMFSTEQNKAQGISAVKAISIAASEGQKIWTIDKNNVNLALSRINLSADAEADIRNAVYAGKIATAHEARINFNGWVGEGYTLIDPNTGAGAYMISGGGNGGAISVPQIYALIVGLIVVSAAALVLSVLAAYGAILLILALCTLSAQTLLALSIIGIWSTVLVELQNIDPGALRGILANLAYGAIGIAIGVLTSSLWVALLVGWLLLSIANYYYSMIEIRSPRSYRYA